MLIYGALCWCLQSWDTAVAMTRLTVTVDEELLSEAQALVASSTKRETIAIALRELVRERKRQAALSHAGSIELNLDQEMLRQYREQR